MPPDGQNVLVTLADGSELLAYWLEDRWYMGVENDPQDVEVTGEVMSWRWAE